MCVLCLFSRFGYEIGGPLTLDDWRPVHSLYPLMRKWLEENFENTPGGSIGESDWDAFWLECVQGATKICVHVDGSTVSRSCEDAIACFLDALWSLVLQADRVLFFLSLSLVLRLTKARFVTNSGGRLVNEEMTFYVWLYLAEYKDTHGHFISAFHFLVPFKIGSSAAKFPMSETFLSSP